MRYKMNDLLPDVLSFRVVLLLIFCTVMASCNNGGEKTNKGIVGDAKESIIGTWQSVQYGGYDIEDGIRTDWEEDYTEEVYTFYEGGKGEYKDTDSNISQSYPFHWEIRDNDQLIIDGDEIYTLITLNDKEMVWEVYEKYGDDISYAKEIFKRIDQPPMSQRSLPVRMTQRQTYLPPSKTLLDCGNILSLSTDQDIFYSFPMAEAE